MTYRDIYSNTEADAGAFEAAHSDWDDDRPSASEIAADEHPVANPATYRCRRGCGGRLWDRDSRDTHEARCDGSDPWAPRPITAATTDPWATSPATTPKESL